MQVPAVLMRGGTSKCWVFDTRELDAVPVDRDSLLLRLYGSPDPRQVDGVGGATSTTSKAVLLSPSAAPGVDVDYTFAQVGIAEERVDWSNNCGNCSTVVGLYALQQGWVTPSGETTRVVVHNTNTDKVILQDVPTPGGAPTNVGDSLIDGVPFPAPRVDLGFSRPGGAVTGALLPTGRPVDELQTSYGSVRASLVDAANPTALLWGPDIGLTGKEVPSAVDGDAELLSVLSEARAHASALMGIAPTSADADRVSRAIPKLAWLAPAEHGDDGVFGRMLSMGKTHPALAVTVSVAFAAAAITSGTVVPRPPGDEPLHIATPSGGVAVRAQCDETGSLEVAFVRRNARRLATAGLEVSV